MAKVNFVTSAISIMDLLYNGYEYLEKRHVHDKRFCGRPLCVYSQIDYKHYCPLKFVNNSLKYA
ncbi:MAG: hypothetical protein ACI3ZD_07655, partial [Prevotella sp.]